MVRRAEELHFEIVERQNRIDQINIERHNRMVHSFWGTEFVLFGNKRLILEPVAPFL